VCKTKTFLKTEKQIRPYSFYPYKIRVLYSGSMATKRNGAGKEDVHKE